MNFPLRFHSKKSSRKEVLTKKMKHKELRAVLATHGVDPVGNQAHAWVDEQWVCKEKTSPTET